MQATRQKWEYATEEGANLVEMNDALTRRGADGWELVNVVNNPIQTTGLPAKTLRNKRHDQLIAFFKRAVND